MHSRIRKTIDPRIPATPGRTVGVGEREERQEAVNHAGKTVYSVGAGNEGRKQRSSATIEPITTEQKGRPQARRRDGFP